jgi:hypothetical protein
LSAEILAVSSWTGGLTRLFVAESGTRRVEIGGIVSAPDSAWVVLRSRQITDPADGCLRGKCFLLHDLDSLFGGGVRETLAATGVGTGYRTPFQLAFRT